MRPQSFISLRALCFLVFMAHTFCGGSASNSTTSKPDTTANYSRITTENVSLTTPPTSSVTFATHGSKPQSMSTTSTISAMSKDIKPTTASTSTATSGQEPSKTGTIVCLIFFICFIFVLLFCAYKWYVHHGRPSFREIWRTVAETAGNLWELAVACLSESSKREEADEEMEAGIAEAEEEKQQEEDAENDNKDDGDDDSSDDYSSIDEAVVKEEPKKGDDDDDDRRNNERDDDDDDDMSSVELKDEKREKDDLTVL